MDYKERAESAEHNFGIEHDKVVQLEKELKTICELRNGLIDENKALRGFILSMASQIGIIVKKL